MITGHGVDIVSVEEISRLLNDPDEHFLTRCFTDLERTSANSRGIDRIEHLAGKFAAKEAVLKALGVGFDGSIAFSEIEILNLLSGAPEVTLHGGALDAARALGVSRWFISLSHDGGMAMASAIAVR